VTAMRIAVLAWGSLVWQPRNRHGEIRLAGTWHDDGPLLPVEFARISVDGRLTLILVPGYPHRSPVLWAGSAFSDVTAARANLAERETGAPIEEVHGVAAGGDVIGAPAGPVVATVSQWLGCRSLDAAIWTGLGPGGRWEGGFGVDAAVDYVSGLTGEERRRALEYVRRAPEQIDTPVRRALRHLC